MENGTTNWGQSVTGVVIKDNKVLLARHTYGGGKGLLIVPGGYVNVDETPQEALVREDVPELTKKLIESAVKKDAGLHKEEYNGSTKHGPYSLYCL